MAIALLSCATAFFVTPPVGVGATLARSAVAPTAPSVSVPKHWGATSPRARPPLMFDGGLDSLGIDELRSLLTSRGVVYEADASKDDLVQLLQASAARTVVPELDAPTAPEIAAPPLSPPPTLTPSEIQRVEVFDRVAPSVAYIQTTVVQKSPFSLGSNEYPAGAGSGFVWDTEGHIITNFHVINGGPLGARRGGDVPRKVKVKLHGIAEAVDATVVGMEPDKDLAVLKVDPSALAAPLRPLDVGSSSGLRVGQSVLAIGNPFGLDWTLTQGIVSALGRDIDGAGGRPIKDCVQTDAAINPGNSGGPLLDSSGNLIGVNTMIYAPGGLGANVGIGFAVPVDTVNRIVTQILTHGENARPSIGVSVLPDQIRQQYSRNLKRELDGAIIAEVVPGSPAASLQLQACVRQKAGVLLGDMITAVNGEPIARNEDLLCAIEEAERDAPLTLTVMRNCDPASVEELTITPVPRKALEAR